METTPVLHSGEIKWEKEDLWYQPENKPRLDPSVVEWLSKRFRHLPRYWWQPGEFWKWRRPEWDGRGQYNFISFMVKKLEREERLENRFHAKYRAEGSFNVKIGTGRSMSLAEHAKLHPPKPYTWKWRHPFIGRPTDEPVDFDTQLYLPECIMGQDGAQRMICPKHLRSDDRAKAEADMCGQGH